MYIICDVKAYIVTGLPSIVVCFFELFELNKEYLMKHHEKDNILKVGKQAEEIFFENCNTQCNLLILNVSSYIRTCC